MNAITVGIIVFACLCGAGLLAMRLRAMLPEHHLTVETKDTVKLAVGLVVTMSGLLLGLLVASAKGTYDTDRNEVIQIAGKIAFLDRLLMLYGPDAAPVRAELRKSFEDLIRHIWSDNPGDTSAADTKGGNQFFTSLERLSPQDEVQRGLKTRATSLAVEIGELRSLLVAQSFSSVSKMLVIILVFWLVFVFISFGLFAPGNITAALAIAVSALSVSGAIFLMLELDQPLNGLIHISRDPMTTTLQRMAH